MPIFGPELIVGDPGGGFKRREGDGGSRPSGVLFFDDLEDNGAATEIDDELTWGAAAGLNLPLRDSRWFFSTTLSYLRARGTLDDRVAVRGRRIILGRVAQNSEDPTPIEFDQLTLHLGVGYHF